MPNFPGLIERKPTLEASLTAASLPVARLLESSLAGLELTQAEGETLFKTEGVDLSAVLHAADAVRTQRVGDKATFVVVRNINFTNVCYMACQFCNFGVRKDAAGAEWLSLHEVARRAEEAWNRGGTEVCIQGGLHPDLPADYYVRILEAVKHRVPDIHVHAFSPFEIWYGVRKSRIPLAAYLKQLKQAGLGSMPGTAAEILDTEIRLQLTRNKLSADEWETIIRAAHGAGIRTTATIMYGHIDGPAHWAAHIARIRAIQKDTGGFTEFVPLGFIHEQTRLYRDHPAARPGPTTVESLKMHAVARLMLAGHIDNIQVSWVKLGPEMAHAMLGCGANDLGGTLMNESISRAAGAGHGQEITPSEMVRIIRAAGRVPVQRNTLYGTVENFSDHDPTDIAPLVDRSHGANPVAFLDGRAAAMAAQ
ncbi:MAG TPA: 5-amino-6-(D-ribitylamino)uracil--L-tyrosine 4-hydroxyphenyl transferase CofH [Mesorhizobium sp.]|jgi:FO synthase|uniref:5-amino-6-(D-ribitylamino)uracil--L-tyrosine 4-hydroxyphenyl transferase CofH n=1 Tax=Mesorhizobium sp. TaxID=1871066 RepID=UPI002DDCB555|nr:5-amino-6-(D-ribitylamino)uracil--L-tyrosine 4-hydroxyphenyl transferase CofH [Mesorhizobium sp.]HEV2507860.1 5-amino-6-(D-ribitylamino)uracil--L-tyrosine 4-hydroxyphenyl transferase CofH [Mesorhizobium sp.]